VVVDESGYIQVINQQLENVLAIKTGNYRTIG
jgi:hypothetical protein